MKKHLDSIVKTLDSIEEHKFTPELKAIKASTISAIEDLDKMKDFMSSLKQEVDCALNYYIK